MPCDLKDNLCKAPIYFFDTLSSTMDWAHHLAASGATSQTLIVARKQSQGRGRRGRAWVSETGNVHLSAVLRPKGLLSEHQLLSFVLCLAVGETLAFKLRQDGQMKKKIFYKWPNDVLLEQKKIGGILLEAETNPETKEIRWMIGGVGVNLMAHPSDSAFPATSLKHEGILWSVEEFLPVFSKFLGKFFNSYKKNKLLYLKPLWLARAYGKRHPLHLVFNSVYLPGTFHDLDDQTGSLIFKTSSGTLQTISAGDTFSFLTSPPC